jgi:hypothetical protein
MYPFLRPGDRLIIRRVPPERLRRGDIVVLDDKGRLVAHRLVRRLPGGRVVLKGDSLPAPDSPLPNPARIIGRVEALTRRRRLITLTHGPRSRLNPVYAGLSLLNLTPGALRLKIKNGLLLLVQGSRRDDPADSGRKALRALLGNPKSAPTRLPEEADLIALKEAACREGVAGIVYAHLRENGLSRDLLSSFEELYQQIAAPNLANLNALEDIERALRDTTIEVLTLKGASLLDRIYPGIGMRPMGDIDLMVHPEDREGFAKVLLDLGYRQDPTLTHLFTREGVIVDLHTHALNTDRIAARNALLPRGMAPFWRRAVPWRTGFLRIRRPEDRDNVLLLAQHLMKHSFSGLLWLVDIHELLRNRDARFWKDLKKRAGELLQIKPLFYALYLLERTFDLVPPPGAGLRHPGERLSRLERGILGARAGGLSIAPLGALLALSCIPEPGKRLALFLETLFPNRDVMNKEFPSAYRHKRGTFCLHRATRATAAGGRRLSLILSALIRGS